MTSLPSLPILALRQPLEEESSSIPSTFRDFCAGKVGVIDLWHTKCTRCPAALGKLNEVAANFDQDKVMAIACALSLGSSNLDDINEYINE